MIDGKPRAVWEPGILHYTSWTGEELTYNPAYEPWKIDKNAPLTLKCNEAFKAVFEKEPERIFDDMNWSHNSSTTSNEYIKPEIKNIFTEEQLNDCQVRRVVNVFMIQDKNFEQIYMACSMNPNRVVFRKIC